MKRINNRQIDEIRNTRITPNYLSHPEGSVLIEMGNTRVICAVSVTNNVPGWMKAQNVPGGWITAEYGMLPSATNERCRREATRGKQTGRTQEIQRLIGRSLRASVDLTKLDNFTVNVDCDVINADGGTRCASITGACIALQMAFKKMLSDERIKENPILDPIAAISVGIYKGTPILDLNYDEDSSAEVDMNIIMTSSGKFVEIQGTAEGHNFSQDELANMLTLAKKGIIDLFEINKNILDQI